MDSLFKDLSLTTDPVDPWNLPGVGWVALALTAVVLLGAAAWSYYRVPAASPRRVAVLVVLRALALGLVFLALAGVSCVSRDEMKVPSLVLVGIDASESMKVNKDERGQARWDALVRTLGQAQPVIDRLRAEHNIQLVFFTFGDKVETFDPDNPGSAEGKYTDTAELLSTLLNRYRGERYLRGLLILSDGADNVASDPPARMLAAQFNGLGCRVHTFAFGSPTTTLAQNDVVVRNLATDPV